MLYWLSKSPADRELTYGGKGRLLLFKILMARSRFCTDKSFAGWP
jgi:hypothetical protein